MGWNGRFSAFARYNRDQGNSVQIQDPSLSQFGQVEVPQNGVLGLNQVWSARLFNEAKFGYNGIKMRVLGVAGPSPNVDLSRSCIAIAGLTNVGVADQPVELVQRRGRAVYGAELLVYR